MFHRIGNKKSNSNVFPECFDAEIFYFDEDIREIHRDHARFTGCNRIKAVLYWTTSTFRSSSPVFSFDTAPASIVFLPLSNNRQTTIDNGPYFPQEVEDLLKAKPYEKVGGFTLQEAVQVSAFPKPLQNARCTNCRMKDNSVISYDYWQVGDVIFIQLMRTLDNNSESTSHNYSTSFISYVNNNNTGNDSYSFTARGSQSEGACNSYDINNYTCNANMWAACDFPEVLDISTITSSSSASSVPSQEDAITCIFDLYGVAVHSGPSNFKHFKSYCCLKTTDPNAW